MASVPAPPPPPQATPSKPAAPGADTMEAPAELAAVVDDLLESLGTKFSGVSKEIYEKLEAMGKRLDALEAGIGQSSGEGAGKS